MNFVLTIDSFQNVPWETLSIYALLQDDTNTNSDDIDKIRRLLEYKNEKYLSDLLRFSYSSINKSSSFGNYYYSVISTFEIYSPLDTHFKLKELTEEDQKEILNAVLEVYPPKDGAVEITTVQFYLDTEIDPAQKRIKPNSEKPPSSINNESYDIFISHSHQDYDQVKELVDTLKQYGFSVFLAHRDIRPSADWEEELLKALFSAAVFIAFITPEFKSSDWCDQETGIAISRGQKIIPIIASSKLDPYGFVRKYQGMRLPIPEAYVSHHIKSVSEKLSISIVETLYNDKGTKDMVKSRIFNTIKQITSYHQTDLIFSVLEKIGPFTDDENKIILEAYDANDQISGAGSADFTISKIRK
jgi:hypothetical protein